MELIQRVTRDGIFFFLLVAVGLIQQQIQSFGVTVTENYKYKYNHYDHQDPTRRPEKTIRTMSTLCTFTSKSCTKITTVTTTTLYSSPSPTSSSNVVVNNTSYPKQLCYYTHNDLVWKLCPTSIMDEDGNDNVDYKEMIRQWRVNFHLFLDQQKQQRQEFNENNNAEEMYIPFILCPPGNEVMIEVYEKNSIEAPTTNNNHPISNNMNENQNDTTNIQQQQLIGRFGIITRSGPFMGPIRETIQTIYGRTNDDDDDNSIQVGAIKFMFVKEEYRKRNVGTLALQVISLIHASLGMEYTILVADDKSSTTNASLKQKNTLDHNNGKLVRWYEQVGNYTVAPLLQDILGSPNGIYGITMIAPTYATILQSSSSLSQENKRTIQECINNIRIVV